jgi:hypothetical protein
MQQKKTTDKENNLKIIQAYQSYRMALYLTKYVAMLTAVI